MPSPSLAQGKDPSQVSELDLLNNAELNSAYYNISSGEWHLSWATGEFMSMMHVMYMNMPALREKHDPWWPGVFVCNQSVDDNILSLPGDASLGYWNVTPYNGENLLSAHSVVLFQSKGLNPLGNLYADPFAIKSRWSSPAYINSSQAGNWLNSIIEWGPQSQFDSQWKKTFIRGVGK